MQHVESDPQHSFRYIRRFDRWRAAGADLVSEARLIDAMAPRRTHSGRRLWPGRVGGFLAAAGHDVVGVDVDPVLIEAAEHDHPDRAGSLVILLKLDLPARGIAEPFDVIVSAGNVATFLAPSTRVQVRPGLKAHLKPEAERSSASAPDRTTTSPTSR